MSGRIRSSGSGRIVRLIVACVVVGALTTGCGASSPSPSPSPSRGPRTEAPSPAATRTANTGGCLIGASWFNGTDLMDWEEPAFQKALQDAGANFQELDARAFVDTQRSDIDRLIAAGAKVIVIEPGPEDVILPALQRATNAGIPVVTLLGSLEHVRSLHVAFDPVEQGRQMARGLLAVKPKGDYAIIKGDSSAWPESDLIASGIREILQPAVDRGDIKIVAAVETQLWDGGFAMQQMTTILKQNGGTVDAVAAESDGMAFGVEQTLAEAGLSGKVAVAGVSDVGGAGGLLAIVRGKQAVDAWGDPSRLGEAAARAAIALCHDPDITRVDGSTSVAWPGRDPMTAILLAPVAITKDNIGIAIQTGMQWRKLICGDIPGAPGLPSACQIGPVPVASASPPSQT
jgi:D-xylose transport system substrate-binding protein